MIGVLFQILDFKRNYGHRPINGSSPDVHGDEDCSSEGEARREKRDPSSAVWKEAEDRKGFQMCNSHVLECPFCTNNNLSLDCQDCVEKVLEDNFGFKVHNLQDSVPSSSSTCLKEPDFVVVGNDGLFNGGYDLSSNTLFGVSLIDIKHNAAIERKADREFGEAVTEAFTFNGIKTDCSCWSSCRLASLS